MNLDEIKELERRIDNVETLLQLQSLTIRALLSTQADIPLLLKCMRGTAEQQDARGLYSTSLSDDQLHRVLAGFRTLISGIEQQVAPSA